MLTRGSVTTYSTCDETEGGDASGGNATQGDDTPAGFATQGDGANYSSGGDADGDSERSTAKPSGRAPAGCAAIERAGSGAGPKRRRGQAPCHKE